MRAMTGAGRIRELMYTLSPPRVARHYNEGGVGTMYFKSSVPLLKEAAVLISLVTSEFDVDTSSHFPSLEWTSDWEQKFDICEARCSWGGGVAEEEVGYSRWKNRFKVL